MLQCDIGLTRRPIDERHIGRDPAPAEVVITENRVELIPAGLRRSLSAAWARNVEEIVQQYPHLKPSDVHDALAYAYEHLDEIDADLAADDEDFVKARYGLAKRP